MRDRKILHPLVLAAAATLLLTVRPVSKAAFGLGFTAVRPTSGIIASVGRGLSNLVRPLTGKRYLMRKNFILRSENEALIAALAVYQAAYEENQRLRMMLDMPLASGEKALVANVVGRSDGVIHINKGSRQGVAPGQVVAAPILSSGAIAAQLVGRVTDVRGNEAVVSTILSSRCKVGVLLAPSRGQGILQGIGAGDPEIAYIPIEKPVGISDRVYTSGVGEVFRSGFYIGRVSRVRDNKHAMLKEVRVKPGVAIDSLQEVLILKRAER